MVTRPQREADPPSGAAPSSPKRKWILGLLLVPSLVLSARSITNYARRPGIGEFCIGPCRSGLCYIPGNDFLRAYCTRACSSGSDCPPDYSCVSAGEGRGSFCRRAPHGVAGERCAAAEECLSNLCVEYVLVDPAKGRFRGRYCVDPCPSVDSCPNGTLCEEIDGDRVCSPKSIIERDARQRFEMEQRLGIENDRVFERRIQREWRQERELKRSEEMEK